MTLCLAAKTGFSQTDFREGYIITNAHDSIPGWVAYREGVKAFAICDFQKVKDQNTVTYRADEIAGYGIINDKSFVSKTIPITDHSETVFLEVLVKGPVTLYNFKGAFWLEKDEKLYPLVNKVTETFVNDKRYLKSSNEHIATLNILLADCAELRTKIQRAVLLEKPLTRLVESYNKCKGQTVVVYKEKKPWFKLNAGIAAGVNVSHLSFDDKDKIHPHLNGTFSSSTSPIGGLSFGVMSPRISERLSLNVDAFYTKSKYSHSVSFDKLTYIYNNTVNIEIQQLKIPVSIRYTLPENTVTPYFCIGASFITHLKSSSKSTEEMVTDSNVIYDYYEALYMRSHQFGIWGGAGISKAINNKWNAYLELRYEQTNGIVSYATYTNQTYLGSKVKNFQVTIGIRTK